MNRLNNRLIFRTLRLQPEQARLMATWGFICGLAILFSLLAVAVFVLYSAASSFEPWASAHLIRSLLGIGIVLFIIWVPIGVWFNYAFWLYGFNVFLLLLIPFLGSSQMGAQRWFDFGSVFIQPSEPMKIFTILALARYFHQLYPKDVFSIIRLGPAIGMIALPFTLIMIQPDLGTALLILFVGIMLFFFAGVKWWKFATLIGVTIVTGPLIWVYLMHDFQRSRVLSFLNPENDLLGSGYQLMQSKIAIGSGGLHGNGFLEGTQSLLGFIPAKHTDFIFALYAEQFGFIGSIGLLLLLLLPVLYSVQAATATRSTFGRLTVLSIASLWLIQSIINLAMVMGLLPVVGIPLPFLSYGGTNLWTSMAGFGFVLNIYVNQYTSLRSDTSR